MTRFSFFVLAAALAAASPALAVDVPLLHSAPAATATTLAPGITYLSPHATAYVPRNAASPAPLILFLHGPGTDAAGIVDTYRGDADNYGAILLALDPKAAAGRSSPAAAARATSGPTRATSMQRLPHCTPRLQSTPPGA